MATKESLMARTIQVGDCIEWTGHINHSGYGSVWHNGKNRDVHRVSCELHHGPIPAGFHVMHTCDNRRCINPDHIRAATRKENMTDMFRKNRQRFSSGSNHHAAKLSNEAAAQIRSRYVPYSRINGSMALSREFGVSQATVHACIRGETWKEAA